MIGIVALKKGTSLSAMIGLAVWLTLTLITPAIINLVVSAKAPIPNRSESIHLVRELNDKIWESDKSFVFEQFYKDNPKYDKGDTTDFSKWYFAGFTLLDKKAFDHIEKQNELAQQRNQMLSQWQWMAPAAMVHEKLSGLAETNRESHLAFLKQVNSFHSELKNVYYKRIFNEELFSTEDLNEIKSKL